MVGAPGGVGADEVTGRIGVQARAIRGRARIEVLAANRAVPQGIGDSVLSPLPGSAEHLPSSAHRGAQSAGALSGRSLDDRPVMGDHFQDPARAAGLHALPGKAVAAPGIAHDQGVVAQTQLRRPPQRPHRQEQQSAPGQCPQPVGSAVRHPDRGNRVDDSRAHGERSQTAEQRTDNDGGHSPILLSDPARALAAARTARSRSCAPAVESSVRASPLLRAEAARAAAPPRVHGSGSGRWRAGPDPLSQPCSRCSRRARRTGPWRRSSPSSWARR